VYIQCFRQGNHQLNGHIRCINIYIYGSGRPYSKHTLQHTHNIYKHTQGGGCTASQRTCAFACCNSTSAFATASAATACSSALLSVSRSTWNCSCNCCCCCSCTVAAVPDALRSSALTCIRMCVCVRMCVYVCIRMCVYVYVCVRVRMYTYMCVCVRMRACTYVYVCVHVRMYTYVCVRLCTCAYIRVHMSCALTLPAQIGTLLFPCSILEVMPVHALFNKHSNSHSLTHTQTRTKVPPARVACSTPAPAVLPLGPPHLLAPLLLLPANCVSKMAGQSDKAAERASSCIFCVRKVAGQSAKAAERASLCISCVSKVAGQSTRQLHVRPYAFPAYVWIVRALTPPTNCSFLCCCLCTCGTTPGWHAVGVRLSVHFCVSWCDLPFYSH